MALARTCVSLTIGMAVLALLAACAPVKLELPFDPAEAAYVLKPGNAAIEGEAFVRKFNGRTANAAGLDIFLLPVTSHTDELIVAIEAGSAVTGVSDQLDTYARVNTVDTKGRFKFEKVAPGDYYVFTRIDWTERAGRDTLRFRKALVARVTVAQGERKTIVLSGSLGR